MKKLLHLTDAIGAAVLLGLALFAFNGTMMAQAASPDAKAHFQAIQQERNDKIAAAKAAAAKAAEEAAKKPLLIDASKPVPTSSKQLVIKDVQQNPLLVIQQFTAADLTAAIAMAQAQNPPDTAAVTCYTAVLGIVNGGVANPLPNGLGVFQGLQAARDAKQLLASLNSTTGPLYAFNTACAPIILDAQNTLLMLGVGVGVVANPAVAAGGASVLGGLTGINAAVLGFLNLPKL